MHKPSAPLEDVLRRIERENEAEKVWIVGPQTGRLLYFLVRVLQPIVSLEVGTSVGYSALWMAEALRQNGRGKLWTIESHAERFKRAKANIAEAQREEFVELVQGHAPEIFPELHLPNTIDFAFFDATKMEHQSYLDGLFAQLSDGAMLAVDNVQSHRFGAMENFVQGIHADPRFEVVEIPVGSGLLLAKRV